MFVAGVPRMEEWQDLRIRALWSVLQIKSGQCYPYFMGSPFFEGLKGAYRNDGRERILVSEGMPNLTKPQLNLHRRMCYLRKYAERVFMEGMRKLLGSGQGLDSPNKPVCLTVTYVLFVFASDAYRGNASNNYKFMILASPLSGNIIPSRWRVKVETPVCHVAVEGGDRCSKAGRQLLQAPLFPARKAPK